MDAKDDDAVDVEGWAAFLRAAMDAMYDDVVDVEGAASD
jgi:hypothetical protein